MKLSIIIPVYNKYNFTKSCLNDLFHLPQDHEIIVIDNASSDETQEELSKIKNDRFVYIRNEENLWHSKACNMGYAVSKSDTVLFLNNDIKVQSNHSDWTSKIFEYSNDFMVGPTVGLLDKQLNFVSEGNRQPKSFKDAHFYISGWCVAASKTIWDKLKVRGDQVWDEDLPFYFNDTWLSFHAKAIGVDMKVIDIPVKHFGKVSSKQVNTFKLYSEGRKAFLEKYKK